MSLGDSWVSVRLFCAKGNYNREFESKSEIFEPDPEMTNCDLYWRAGRVPTQILAFPNQKRAGMKSSYFFFFPFGFPLFPRRRAKIAKM